MSATPGITQYDHHNPTGEADELPEVDTEQELSHEQRYYPARPEIGIRFRQACVQGPWSVLQLFVEQSPNNNPEIDLPAEQLSQLPPNQLIHTHAPSIIRFCSKVMNWDPTETQSAITCLEAFFERQTPFTHTEDDPPFDNSLRPRLSFDETEEFFQIVRDQSAREAEELDQELTEEAEHMNTLPSVSVTDQKKALLNSRILEANRRLRTPLEVTVTTLNTHNTWTIEITNPLTGDTLVIPWTSGVVPQEYEDLSSLIRDICGSLGTQTSDSPIPSFTRSSSPDSPNHSWPATRQKLGLLLNALDGSCTPLHYSTHDSTQGDLPASAHQILKKLQEFVTQKIAPQEGIPRLNIDPDLNVSIQGLAGTGKSTLREILHLVLNSEVAEVRNGDVFATGTLGPSSLRGSKIAIPPPENLPYLRTIRASHPITELPASMQLAILLDLLPQPHTDPDRADPQARIRLTDSGGPPPYRPERSTQPHPFGTGLQETLQAAANDLILYMADFRIPHSELIRNAFGHIELTNDDLANPLISGPLYDLLIYGSESLTGNDLEELLNSENSLYRNFLLEAVATALETDYPQISHQIDSAPTNGTTNVGALISTFKRNNIELDDLVNLGDVSTAIHEIRKDLYQPDREELIQICSSNTDPARQCRRILLTGIHQLDKTIDEDGQALLNAALNNNGQWRQVRNALKSGRIEDIKPLEQLLTPIIRKFLSSPYDPNQKHEVRPHPYNPHKQKAEREQERLLSLALFVDPAMITVAPMYRMSDLYPPGYFNLIEECGMNPPVNEFYFNNLMYVILSKLRTSLQQKTDRLERMIHSLASLEKVPNELREDFQSLIPLLSRLRLDLDKSRGSLYFTISRVLDRLDEQKIEHSIVNMNGSVVRRRILGNKAADTRKIWQQTVAPPLFMSSADDLI